MNVSEIKKNLEISGNQKVILVRNFDQIIAGQNICALLNSGGGFIAFELSDEDRYAYLNNEIEIQNFENKISKEITPKTIFSFEIKNNFKQKLLLIEVPAGKDIPYSYQNNIFVKKRSKAVKADVETIKDMILRKQNDPIRWERRFSDADFNSDFDQDHYGSVLGNMVDSHRFHFTERKNQELYLYLEDLSVYKYGKLTNTGDVIFCKNPAKRYPQTRAKAALFLEDKTDSEFIDFKYFEGPLLIIYKELSNFIARNTPTSAFFPETDSRRQNKQLYPERAIREGLINALVHRDYSNSGGSISVSIYPDRLEIWNYGEFPKGVTLKTLDKGNVSVLRNPDIAHILYLQDYMEKLGRGARLIKKECAEYGLPEPKWKSEKGKGVTLTFFAPEKRRITGGLPADYSTKPAISDGLATDYSLEKNSERRISDGLATDYKKRIREYFNKKNSITTREAKELLGIMDTRVKEILNELIEEGLIERIGEGRSTHYELKK